MYIIENSFRFFFFSPSLTWTVTLKWSQGWHRGRRPRPRSRASPSAREISLAVRWCRVARQPISGRFAVTLPRDSRSAAASPRGADGRPMRRFVRDDVESGKEKNMSENGYCIQSVLIDRQTCRFEWDFICFSTCNCGQSSLVIFWRKYLETFFTLDGDW